jgi:hypothetical protein
VAGGDDTTRPCSKRAVLKMGFLVYGENKCPSPEFGFLKNIEFS